MWGTISKKLSALDLTIFNFFSFFDIFRFTNYIRFIIVARVVLAYLTSAGESPDRQIGGAFSLPIQN